MTTSRRDALLLGLVTAAAAAGASTPAVAGAAVKSGPDGQRQADLGNGKYLNPVLAGDNPDPSVLKDGDTYYKVSSSFDYYPGLLIWQSRDLVSWTPVVATLHKPIGSVFAPDLAKHNGRYFIYFAVLNADMQDPFGGKRPYGNDLPIITNYVVHADAIAGPWSEPVDLGIQQIDPGHGVGEDGKRYLFLADGNRVRLSDDGLKLDGKVEKVYEGWPIPAGWVYETFALEGPKVLRRGDWFYLFAAEGGTAGPPTSHMLVVARSHSIHGPWENCPHNPIVRTKSISEPWWSRGHATPVEGPDGSWWLIYHGYENGFRTLGRQMLLEPMEWTKDGWPRALGGDLSGPMRKPIPNQHGPHGLALSGPFKTEDFGTRLTYYMPGPDYASTVEQINGTLRLAASGSKLQDARVLTMNCGDHSYSVTVEVELGEGATGGLLLFYNKRAFCGLASDQKKLHLYRMGTEATFIAGGGPAIGSHCFLRVNNNANVASFLLSANGTDWRTVCSFEVAGYNHNVFDGFLSLRPAIFAMGKGHVDFKSLSYSAAASPR
jgi:xylan 1,4-beta-xylosidase